MKKVALLLMVAFAVVKPASAQTFHNLNLADKCDTSKTGLCNWDLSWGGKGAVVPAAIGNVNCMLIQGAKENSVGFTEQASYFPPPKGDEFITLTGNHPHR